MSEYDKKNQSREFEDECQVCGLSIPENFAFCDEDCKLAYFNKKETENIVKASIKHFNNCNADKCTCN